MKFLGRARKFLQDLGTEPPAKVQYFNVTCASGHRVRGERTEGYQAIRCPACGDGVFILPRSPLPEPTSPSRQVGAKRAPAWPAERFVDEGPVELIDLPQVEVDLDDRQMGKGEVEIIWDDEPAPLPPIRNTPTSKSAGTDDSQKTELTPPEEAADPGSTARAKNPLKPSRPGQQKPVDRTSPGSPGVQPEPIGQRANTAVSQGRGQKVLRPTTEPEVSRHPSTLPAPPPFQQPRVASRARPRHGLIVISISLLVIAAVGWRVWRQRRQEYPIIAEKGRRDGIPALDAGEFDKAYQLLSAARTAVDALGGAVEGAEDIRRAARESEIFINLCSDKLEDMLAEAARTERNTWESKFDQIYKGRSYIFDTAISAVPSEVGMGTYEVDYLVLPSGESSRFGDGAVARPSFYASLDLTNFELFQATRPNKGDSVKFGCQLAGLIYDENLNHWVVQIMPLSGVFMTHARALEAAGGPVPELIDPLKETEQP